MKIGDLILDTELDILGVVISAKYKNKLGILFDWGVFYQTGYFAGCDSGEMEIINEK